MATTRIIPGLNGAGPGHWQDRWFRCAQALAAPWGADLVDCGDAGHVNVASGFGPWPEGPRLLAAVEARRRRPATAIHLRPRRAPRRFPSPVRRRRVRWRSIHAAC